MFLKVSFISLAISLVLTEDRWSGKWFPMNPNEPRGIDNNISSIEKWKGNWFPENPKTTNEGQSQSKNSKEFEYKENTYERDRIMGKANVECDDAETNLDTDFDPSSADDAKIYTCLEASYKSNVNIEPIETIYDVPRFYTPVHKCMNETIIYDQKIPTLGPHRPLWPIYGEYTYLPPQRWLHSLEHGAIVMLYDPCATKSEVDKLRNIIQKCLYRHIITPYKLTSERPLALVAWAASLEMSTFDAFIATEFIKKYAKTGPEKSSRQGQYKKMLIRQAKVLNDEDDSDICFDGQ